jgi:hypothetical protein
VCHCCAELVLSRKNSVAESCVLLHAEGSWLDAYASPPTSAVTHSGNSCLSCARHARSTEVECTTHKCSAFQTGALAYTTHVQYNALMPKTW